MVQSMPRHLLPTASSACEKCGNVSFPAGILGGSRTRAQVLAGPSRGHASIVRPNAPHVPRSRVVSYFSLSFSSRHPPLSCSTFIHRISFLLPTRPLFLEPGRSTVLLQFTVLNFPAWLRGPGAQPKPTQPAVSRLCLLHQQATPPELEIRHSASQPWLSG